MDWATLPSLCMIEIYELLCSKDKLVSSLVCKNWRTPFFKLRKKHLNLLLKSESDEDKVRFLIEQFGHKVWSLELVVNPNSRTCLDLVQEVLSKLQENKHLKTLKVRFTEDSLSQDVLHGNNFSNLIHRVHVVRSIINPVIQILKSKNCLETISFPLVHELANYNKHIFAELAKSKYYTVQNLFLSSLRLTLAENRDQPNYLPLRNVDHFVNLQMLSIDHDALSDEVLSNLGVGNQLGGLKQLNLVAIKPNEFVSNQGWNSFVANNPFCKVRLTLVGNNAVLDHGSNFLFQSIPLTHFRALYCKGLRMSCLNSLIRWNEETLEYIELVHENHDWMDYVAREPVEDPNTDFIDPIIYAAWRCLNLHTVKISYLYCGESLIGIARLRPTLLQLEIPKSQILYRNMFQLTQEISKALDRPWKPTDTSGGKCQQYQSEKLHSKLVKSMQSMIADENSTSSKFLS